MNNICVVPTQGDAGEPGLPGTIGSSGKTVRRRQFSFQNSALAAYPCRVIVILFAL